MRSRGVVHNGMRSVPKGFASVIYGLLIRQAAVPGAEHLFHFVAVVVAGSTIAHFSTDVLFARWFRRSEGAGPT